MLKAISPALSTLKRQPISVVRTFPVGCYGSIPTVQAPPHHIEEAKESHGSNKELKEKKRSFEDSRSEASTESRVDLDDVSVSEVMSGRYSELKRRRVSAVRHFPSCYVRSLRKVRDGSVMVASSESMVGMGPAKEDGEEEEVGKGNMVIEAIVESEDEVGKGNIIIRVILESPVKDV